MAQINYDPEALEHYADCEICGGTHWGTWPKVAASLQDCAQRSLEHYERTGEKMRFYQDKGPEFEYGLQPPA